MNLCRTLILPRGRTLALALGDLLERMRLELLYQLLKSRDPLLVSGLRAPIPDGGHRFPRAEADERAWAIDIAEQPSLRSEPLSVTPVDPLLPAPDELFLVPRSYLPSRMPSSP